MRTTPAYLVEKVKPAARPRSIHLCREGSLREAAIASIARVAIRAKGASSLM
jgi:hypothetical protein